MHAAYPTGLAHPSVYDYRSRTQEGLELHSGDELLEPLAGGKALGDYRVKAEILGGDLSWPQKSLRTRCRHDFVPNGQRCR